MNKRGIQTQWRLAAEQLVYRDKPNQPRSVSITEPHKQKAVNLEEVSFVYVSHRCNQAAHFLARSASQTTKSIWLNVAPDPGFAL